MPLKTARPDAPIEKASHKRERHSREDFLGLIRKSQTFFGAMPVFLRRWHGDIPTSPRINLFQRILLIGDGSAARTAFGYYLFRVAYKLARIRPIPSSFNDLGCCKVHRESDAYKSIRPSPPG